MATKGATPSSVRASNGDFHKCRCDQQPANKTCCPTNVSHRLKPEAQKYPASRGCKTSHGQGAGPGYKKGGVPPPLRVSCRGGACPYPLSSRPLPHLLLLSLGQVRRQRVNLFTRLELVLNPFSRSYFRPATSGTIVDKYNGRVVYSANTFCQNELLTPPARRQNPNRPHGA